MADYPHQPQLPPWREDLTFTPSGQHPQGQIIVPLANNSTLNRGVKDPKYSDEFAA
jgi:hypothetical protein